MIVLKAVGTTPLAQACLMQACATSNSSGNSWAFLAARCMLTRWQRAPVGHVCVDQEEPVKLGGHHAALQAQVQAHAG